MSETKNCQAPCVDCDIEPFTRNYYFTGKLLVERDFKQEQEYYVNKFRHHDQTLHGWGVVCGLKVKAHQNPQCRNRFVCIEPGTAIDCCGHEILVHDEDYIEITQLAAIKALAAKNDSAAHTLQICIRYRECPTEQIPVLYDDCGCNETQCAPNRVLESYDVDVIVDPTDKPQSSTSPGLQWNNTINVAHSQSVALNESTRRLYILTSDNPAAIYEVSIDNLSIVASHTITAAEGAAQAIAISNDGSQLFVVLSSGTLLVLNTSDFSEAATTTIPGAGVGIKVDLAVAPNPDNRLLSLVETTGAVAVWPLSMTTGVAPAVTINLGSASTGIKASSGATLTYSVGTNSGATTNENVEVGTIATASAVSTSVLPSDAVPTAIALVASASGDQLAVVDQKGRLFLVAMTSPPTLVGTAPLANPGISVASSPDGLWAYALEKDAAGNNFVEPVNLGDLRQNLPLVTSSPLPVGANSQQLVLSLSGDTLYVPYVGNAAVVADGGVAILNVSETACCDLFWKSLDGCPSCATADCIVLATIKNYEVGFFLQDQTDPPADPAQDLTQHFARIDNHTRHLLPSTSTIAEVVQCLCESKGAKGPKGDPGAPGPPGQTGLGLNPGLPKIIDIGWSHKQSIPWETFQLYISGYQTAGSLLPQIKRHLADNDPPILTVYFNQPTLTGIDRQTFTVTIEYPGFYNPYLSNVTEVPDGLYALPLKLYGYPTLIPGPLTTPHTGETAQSAAAFVIDSNLLPYLENNNGAAITAIFTGATTLKPPLDLPCVSIRLKGDFIYAATAFSDGAMLDADNIGGQLGISETRGGPITGGKNPSGDMVEGGDFESWFFLQPPQNTDLTHANLTNPNSASATSLAELPGLSATIAKKIVADRRVNGPFANLDDLAKRVNLSDKIVNALRDQITFE